MKKSLLFTAGLLVTAMSYAQLNTNLVLNYTFDAQNVQDMSGNNNHGTAYYLTSVNDRFGNSNMAYYFDGDSARIEMPNSVLINTDVSISLWFNTTDNGVMIGHQNNPVYQGSVNLVPIIYIGLDSVLHTNFWSGSTQNINQDSTVYNDGNWHHVVLTATATDQKVYIDNVLKGTGPGMVFFAGMIANQIGSGRTNFNWPGGNNSIMPYKGNLDDIRIYHKELSVTEVDSLYNFPSPNFSGIQQHAVVDVKVYPNPSSGNFEMNAFANVSVLDINGKVVFTAGNTKSIDLSSFASGVYVLNIMDDEGNITVRKKLIKE